MLESEDKIIERELLKYALEPNVNDERIDKKDRMSIENSVKNIAIKEIDKAVIKIINHTRKSLEEQEIELPISKDIRIKADWLDKCILLKPEGRIEITVGCQLTNRKKWDDTKILINDQEVYYTQIYQKETSTRIDDSDEARKAFKVIFEEAAKIK